MEDMYFTNHRKFNEYVEDAVPFLNQGREGTTYLKDGVVIKDFGVKPVLDTKHVLQFRDLDLKDFFFPKAGIYVRTKLRACITEYAPGLTLDEKEIFAEDVKVVLAAVERLEGTIEELSYNKIRTKDVHVGNVVFDKDHFNIIDTIPYYRSPMEEDDIYRLNMKDVIRNTLGNVLPIDLYGILLKLRSADVVYSFPHDSLVMLTDYLERMIGHFESFAEAQDIIDKQKIMLPKK